jgi:hypothetical protein
VESKKVELAEVQSKMMVTRGCWGRKAGKTLANGRKISPSRKKIKRSIVQPSDYRKEQCIIFLKIPERIDFKFSPQKMTNI